MKHNILYSALVALALIGTASCSESFNDHYEAFDTSTSGTLWQSITQNPETSNFAKVLQATGYDRDLAGSQVLTVFAPTNDVLTDEKTQQLIDSYYTELKQLYNNDPLKRSRTTTVKEFVQNHVALYNHSVSGGMQPDKIYMLNGKYITLTDNSFGSVGVKTKNQQVGNGVLFTLGGLVKYSPSIFELVKQDPDLKNVSDFLYEPVADVYNPNKKYYFHVEKLNEALSVPGDIVDGEQTYLDSVLYIDNTIINDIRARIDKEDSTYYAVFPKNELWNKLVQQNEKYFVYPKNNQVVDKYDSLTTIMPRLSVLWGAQFSKTINPKLGVSQDIDSIKSPFAIKYENRYRFSENKDMIWEYKQPYAQGGVFDGTTPVECSNGVLMKTDKWNFNPTNGFLISSVMEAEDDATNDEENKKESSEYYNTTWDVRSVSADNPWYHKISGHQLAIMTPRQNFGSQLLDFTNVFSGVPYDLYIVTAPSTAADELTLDVLPTRFKVTLYYTDITGKLVEREIKPEDSERMEYYENKDTYNFLVDPTKIDKIKVLSNFTFPTCSFETVNPLVKIKIETDLFIGDLGMHVYTNTLYIDRIMLIPKVD